MTKHVLALALLALTLPVAHTPAANAQESATATQALVSFDSKTPVAATAKDLTIKVDNRLTPLVNLAAGPSQWDPGGPAHRRRSPHQHRQRAQ